MLTNESITAMSSSVNLKRKEHYFDSESFPSVFTSHYKLFGEGNLLGEEQRISLEVPDIEVLLDSARSD